MWYNINRNGQLGNRLFSRAHVYAAAIEYGEKVVDWGLLDVARYFPKVRMTRLPIYPISEDGEHPVLPDNLMTKHGVLYTLHKLRPRMTGPLFNFWNYHWNTGDPETMRLDSQRFRDFHARHDTIILNGFKIRCPEWVAKHRSRICEYFQMSPSVVDAWQSRREMLKEQYEEIIGLHIRGTDFRTAAGGRYFLDPGEYAELVLQRSSLDLQNSLIRVFSDEPFAGAKSNEDLVRIFCGAGVEFSGGTVEEDLCGMMHCDRLIGAANSTFSRWAAFASDLEWAGVDRAFYESGDFLSFEKCPIPWSY